MGGGGGGGGRVAERWSKSHVSGSHPFVKKDILCNAAIRLPDFAKLNSLVLILFSLSLLRRV